MGRILAIDYGRKRCGVAVSDPLKICANGLPTVRACDLLPFLTEYCGKEDVERIVVGLPKTLSGELSESNAYINPFLKQLAAALPHIPVVRYDERFTSTIAHREMALAGIKKSKREQKDLADKTAAVIILTDYLTHSVSF